MGKGKYKQKKTTHECKQYRSMLGENGVGMNSTYEDENSMLLGSDHVTAAYRSEKHEQLPIAKKSFGLKLKDWFYENWPGILIISILFPIIAWFAVTFFDIHDRVIIFETKIEKMESEIDSLQASTADKDEVARGLQEIKSNIYTSNFSLAQTHGKACSKNLIESNNMVLGINEYLSEDKNDYI